MTARSSPGLRERVGALLREAAAVYAGTEWERRLVAAAADANGPLRVAVAGRVKAGKSTLLNALVGDAVAATDAGECTRIVTEYVYGETEFATVLRSGADGEAGPVPEAGTAASAAGTAPETVALPVCRSGPGPVLDLAAVGGTADGIARMVVRIHNDRLRGLTVIDTPGLASLSRELGAGAERFLLGGTDEVAAPDAVLYLMRQLHTADTNFLTTFRDPAARRVPPVNAIGVLSRADEIGGGRADALSLASSLARDYAEDPRLRSFVQTVVPVAGLLAESAVLLTEKEFETLRALAKLATSVTDALLLSTDRFVGSWRFVPADKAAREALLARLGVFGVRSSLGALRAGDVRDAAGLRSALAARSGIDDLRALLASQILGRRDVIKAEAALRLVRRAVVAVNRPGGRRLAAMAERLTLGVHDFAELRLLNDLRLGEVVVDDSLRQRMERLLGAAGGDVRTRLGLTTDADVAMIRRELAAEHRQWQVLAGDPLTEPSVRRASDVLLRTLQGFRRDLAQTPPSTDVGKHAPG